MTLKNTILRFNTNVIVPKGPIFLMSTTSPASQVDVMPNSIYQLQLDTFLGTWWIGIIFLVKLGIALHRKMTILVLVKKSWKFFGFAPKLSEISSFYFISLECNIPSNFT